MEQNHLNKLRKIIQEEIRSIYEGRGISDFIKDYAEIFKEEIISFLSEHLTNYSPQTVKKRLENSNKEIELQQYHIEIPDFIKSKIIKRIEETPNYSSFPISDNSHDTNIVFYINVSPELLNSSMSLEVESGKLKINFLDKITNLDISGFIVLKSIDNLLEELKDLNSYFAHEFVHLYEEYNILLKNEKLHKGHSVKGIFPYYLEKYKNGAINQKWFDFIRIFYICLPHEINSRISQLYFEIKNKNINSEEQISKEIHNTQAYKDFEMIKHFNPSQFYQDYIAEYGKESLRLLTLEFYQVYEEIIKRSNLPHNFIIPKNLKYLDFFVKFDENIFKKQVVYIDKKIKRIIKELIEDQDRMMSENIQKELFNTKTFPTSTIYGLGIKL